MATTPTTSPAAAVTSPGTRTRTNPPSKTCSPNSAEHSSQHELQALPQLNPTPANTTTTNWPAPQLPHNCETQGITMPTKSHIVERDLRIGELGTGEHRVGQRGA